MALLMIASAILLPFAAAEPSSTALRGANATDERALTGSSATALAAGAFHFVWDPLKLYCLSSDENRIEDGVKVHLWECDYTWRSAGQNMYLDSNGRLRMHASSSYCVVVDGDNFKNGAQVQLWRCDEDNKNQVWSYSGAGAGHLQTVWSQRPMCMAIDGNDAHNGAKIQLWSCSESPSKTQDWLQVSLGRAQKTMYAVPNADMGCPSPFLPVAGDTNACAAAANSLRPGSGCQWPGTAQRSWAEVVEAVDDPSRPKGCYFYGACQGGCGLYFNPTGFVDPLRSGSGFCYSVNVICQLRVP